MADSQELHPPKSGFSPGGYLPRLWKAAPEPAPEPVPPKKPKKRGANGAPLKGKDRKARPGDDEDDGTKKGVLFEETPSLDTVEARRTVRIVAGIVASLLLLLVLFVLFRVFSASSTEDGPSASEGVVVVDIRAQRERSETEARNMIERAREVDRNGNSELAVSLLTRLAAAYPETKAARDAREAIGRPHQNLPLFPDPAQAPKPAASPAPIASAKKAEAGPPEVKAATPPTPAASPEAPAAPKASEQVPSNPEAALAANSSVAPVQPKTAVSTSTSPSPAPSPPPPSRPLPAGYQARSGVGVDPSGWPKEIVGGRDGSMMVLVPGGSFVMGRDGGDPAEAPAHQVRVSTFYIDKHEVTNRQFEHFTKETGPRPERSRALAREGDGINLSDDYPVVMVSAKDAKDYADWAGKRMATEAQWEFAARGTDNRPYPWGPLPPVWEKRREPRQIDAVMSFPSDISPAGAFDMAGNALEWTRDWFDSHYFQNFRGVVAEDPTGPSARPASLQLTVKGGSNQWIVSAREGIKYESRHPYLGFRCVLPVEGPDSGPPPAQNRTPKPGERVIVPF